MNEINFRIDIEKFKIVITYDKYKIFYITNSNNRDYCIVIKCINAINYDIIFLLIMKIDNVLLKWNMHNNLKNRIAFNVNKIEYNNDDLTLNWLQHFIDNIEKKTNKTSYFIHCKRFRLVYDYTIQQFRHDQ